MAERMSTIKHSFSTLSIWRVCIGEYEVRNLCWKFEVCKIRNSIMQLPWQAVTVNWSIGPNLLSNLSGHWSFQVKVLPVKPLQTEMVCGKFSELDGEVNKTAQIEGLQLSNFLLEVQIWCASRGFIWYCIPWDTLVIWWNIVQFSLPGMNHIFWSLEGPF